MAKMEDILFWVLISLIVGVAIWKLFGSPTNTAALISVALFVAGSEILIWKAFFGIDKKTCVGFERVKSQYETIKKDINYIKDELNQIKILIKNKK